MVSRNFFGAQIHSFEALLPAPACLCSLPADLAESSSSSAVPAANGNSAAEAQDYRAVFIRAPAIMESGPSVEILSEYVLSPSEKESQVRAIWLPGHLPVMAVLVTPVGLCCLLGSLVSKKSACLMQRWLHVMRIAMMSRSRGCNEHSASSASSTSSTSLLHLWVPSVLCYLC